MWTFGKGFAIYARGVATVRRAVDVTGSRLVVLGWRAAIRGAVVGYYPTRAAAVAAVESSFACADKRA